MSRHVDPPSRPAGPGLPLVERISLRVGPLTVLAAIVVTAAIGVVVGAMVGTDWAAAETRAGQQMIWSYHIATALQVPLRGLFIAFVPALVVGMSQVSWRRMALLVLVGTFTAALVAGFVWGSGLGTPEQPDEGETLLLALVVVPLVTLGALLGYGIGFLARGAPAPPPPPVDPLEPGRDENAGVGRG